MKQIYLNSLLLLLVCQVGAKAVAHEIAVANADGITIYYNCINNNTALEVTYRANSPYIYDEYTGNVIIPEKVTYGGMTYPVASIGDYAFCGCSSLTAVTISNSVTSIGEDAFSNCSGLTSINIPNSVTTIGEGAFYQCRNLTSITIPNSVTSIGNNAFNKCSGLTAVTIPNSVTSIGHYAFQGCSGLTSINIPNNVTFIDTGTFEDCSSLISVTIGNSVTTIGNYAFSGCSSLTAVTIPNSVMTIGNSVFRNCCLHSLIIGTNVSLIETYAFTNSSIDIVVWLTNTPPSGYGGSKGKINYVSNGQYTSLSNKMVYPFLSSMFEVDGVRYVPVSPSERTCDAIDCPYSDATTNIHIGSTVSYQGISMTVREVNPYFCYKNPYIQSVIIEHVGIIGKYSFSGCTALKDLQIGGNVSTIETYAFQGCTSLKDVTIGNGVTTIGDWAFSGCCGLEYFAFGSSVKTIGKEAFSDCTAMTRIISRVTVPPTCDSQALDDINKWICKLSVPEGFTSAYQQADQWKEFFFIDNDISGINNLTNGEKMIVKDYFTLNGKQIDAPQHGLNIIRMSDGTVRKVLVGDKR